MEDVAKHKEIVHQFYLNGTLLEKKLRKRVFVKLDSRYADYFQNIQITLEEIWDYWSLCIVWLTLGSYFMMS